MDLIVGFSAIFIIALFPCTGDPSCHTMERLVEANSRPFIQFETSNGQTRPDGEVVRELSATVSNPGAGAARIEQFEISVDRRAFSAWPEALGQLKEDAAAQHVIAADMKLGRFTYANIVPSYLRSSGEQVILRWNRDESNGALWDYVDGAAGKANRPESLLLLDLRSVLDGKHGVLPTGPGEELFLIEMCWRLNQMAG